MELHEALAPDVGIETFYEECLPALFEERRELFASVCEVPLIISVYLEDIDLRYTAEFRPDGCRVEPGEMIDFPVATLVGSSTDWDVVKRQTLRIVTPLEERAEGYRPPRKVTRAFLDDLERFDGEFAFILSDNTLDEPVEIGVVLNDYTLPPGAPKLTIETRFEVGERLARGDLSPSQLDASVKLGGDVGLGIDVGGLLLEHFPELEG